MGLPPAHLLYQPSLPLIYLCKPILPAGPLWLPQGVPVTPPTSVKFKMINILFSPFSQVFPDAREFEIHGSQFVNVHGNMVHQMAPSPTVFEPQQGLQTPQMILPNTPSPPATVHSESGNYSSQLLGQGRGFPLYVPGPQRNLAAEYRRRGVAIGDVGRVTPEGSFDFFFNIYLPANHPINANAPADFVPLSPYDPVDVAHHDFDPGNYVSGPSVHEINGDDPDSEQVERINV
ncbi:WD40 containing domain protein [Mycena venus]|uniref:WD40 containing domain protein n=1 Tax=Mycena venus TaxID=2733690 RepID=A0A8H7D2C4_9AGAR|nr:WD40 containing domain protein [Mycena venus]